MSTSSASFATRWSKIKVSNRMIFVFPQGIDPYPMYWLIDRSVNRFVKQTIFRFNRNEIIGLFHCDPSNQSLQRFNPREISCSNHLDYPFLALAEKRGILREGKKSWTKFLTCDDVARKQRSGSVPPDQIRDTIPR